MFFFVSLMYDHDHYLVSGDYHDDDDDDVMFMFMFLYNAYNFISFIKLS